MTTLDLLMGHFIKFVNLGTTCPIKDGLMGEKKMLFIQHNHDGSPWVVQIFPP
jgi:hypothetical protein